jgi:hypothetical protein
MVFVVPGGGMVTIPAPWGYNFFWAIGRSASEALSAARGDLPDWSPGRAGANLMSTGLNAFMPVGGGTFAQTLTPTLFDPVIQIGENKDAFGTQLKPEPFPGQELPLSEQYWSNATNLSKKLAQITNSLFGGDAVQQGAVSFSPEWLDAVASQVFGSVGRQISNVTELPVKLFSGEDVELRDVPVIRKYTTLPSSAQETATYHDRVAQVLKAERQLKAYSEGPRADLQKARELRQDRRVLLRMTEYTKDVERQLRSLRKRLATAQATGRMEDAEVIRERMKMLRERYNDTWRRRVTN